MSSVMRCRRDVIESSFAKGNVLQAATPSFRMGVLSGRQQANSTAQRLCVQNCLHCAITAERFSPGNVMDCTPLRSADPQHPRHGTASGTSRAEFVNEH